MAVVLRCLFLFEPQHLAGNEHWMLIGRFSCMVIGRFFVCCIEDSPG